MLILIPVLAVMGVGTGIIECQKAFCSHSHSMSCHHFSARQTTYGLAVFFIALAVLLAAVCTALYFGWI